MLIAVRLVVLALVISIGMANWNNDSKLYYYVANEESLP